MRRIRLGTKRGKEKKKKDPPPQKKKKKKRDEEKKEREFRLDSNDFGFIGAGVCSEGGYAKNA